MQYVCCCIHCSCHAPCESHISNNTVTDGARWDVYITLTGPIKLAFTFNTFTVGMSRNTAQLTGARDAQNKTKNYRGRCELTNAVSTAGSFFFQSL